MMFAPFVVFVALCGGRNSVSQEVLSDSIAFSDSDFLGLSILIDGQRELWTRKISDEHWNRTRLNSGEVLIGSSRGSFVVGRPALVRIGNRAGSPRESLISGSAYVASKNGVNILAIAPGRLVVERPEQSGAAPVIVNQDWHDIDSIDVAPSGDLLVIADNARKGSVVILKSGGARKVVSIHPDAASGIRVIGLSFRTNDHVLILAVDDRPGPSVPAYIVDLNVRSHQHVVLRRLKVSRIDGRFAPLAPSGQRLAFSNGKIAVLASQNEVMHFDLLNKGKEYLEKIGVK